MTEGTQVDSSPRTPTLRPSDFKFGKEIGQGSFSSVYVAREIATNAEFAIKVVDKQHILRNRAVESVLMEKEVLTRTNHVFIIRLHCTFQDSSRLFYVLEYARHGELLTYLNRLTSFDVQCSRFYAAEILVALNYLHSHSIVHRDLKPENVLLSESMHTKLADFGSAIILNEPKIKAPSFTGTPEYVSPEMLSPHSLNSSASAPSPSHTFEELAYLMDYWALACMIYQFISGRPPFRAERDRHAYETFGKIFSLSYSFMESFDPLAKDLVQRLLVINPLNRIGSPVNGGPAALKSHPFFDGIDWETLHMQTPSALAPNLEPIAPSDWDANPSYNTTTNEQVLDVTPENLIIGQLTDAEHTRLFTLQEQHNPYHRFCRNRLILRQGVLFKRRGLFARKRMFLLTEGPHLFYIDNDSMVLKGEVPWSSSLVLEQKSDKLFFIHVSGRTFYLEDPTGHASAWVAHITAVRNFYYTDSPDHGRSSAPSGDSALPDLCS
ncbi:unnamed protein product [Dicrocoelium dendriticum]|nr:unnamed protein product [Dicrocoelium dendriticum]